MVEINEEDYLAHYGILRRSGRYPWGTSGWGSKIDQATFPRNATFLETADWLRRQGLNDVEIARGFGISTTQLRALRTVEKNAKRQADIAFAQKLKDKGYSNVAIGERMGINESSVRALLAPGAKDKTDVLISTADMLKRQVEEKGFLDVGAGVEQYAGISKEKLNAALAILEEEGYSVNRVKVKQLGTGLDTEMKVLSPPGVTQKDVFLNRDKIQQIQEFSDDGGRTYFGLAEPLSVDPKRVGINYAEDGGSTADGVIYVRPGVEDISLGNANYAQVRIKVGDNKYLKGMAMYKDDLPEGVDLLFNTNKSKEGNDKLSVMKDLKDDPDNPFGAYISKQIVTKDENGNDRAVSAMNIVNEEGDWTNWSKNISSQVLSKQSPALAKSQLDVTFSRRQKEFDEIMALTNPTVKRKLLEEFAESTDSAAVHLKAAALPRQGWHAILPINSLSESEIYAPNYRDGESVVLIRYPHGGTFEIPELKVNNRNREARTLLGQARDAVGINHKVAERLSGADFDGDTVLVIPNNNRRVKTSPALESLKGFDPRSEYPAYPGMKPITASRKQQLMGDVSNLITDMTIRGASHEDIARAVKHSMVIIDAEKHNLDYKRSAAENGIRQLKEQYQGSGKAGASTLISRATSETRVPERIERRMRDGGPVDPKTGKKVYTETGRTYTDAQGRTRLKTQRSQKLAETDDAHTLSSGTPMERLYAEHSNRLKDMANRARREAINTPPVKYSPSAAKAYSKEVSSLNSKLALANRNKPLERQAQVFANNIVRVKKQANPNMDKDTERKVKSQALETARSRTGARKQRIQIDASEWDAIQAGAISNSKLRQILTNADMDTVRQHATPRRELLMNSQNTQRARQMLASGYTRAEVADALGVSLTTLDNATNG